MGKVEQGIEEWQHAVTEEEGIAGGHDGGIAEHSWVLWLWRQGGRRRGERREHEEEREGGRGREGGREGGREEGEKGREGNNLFDINTTSATHYTVNTVVVEGEGVECSQLHPPSAQLLRCVLFKATNNGTNLPERERERERERENGGLSIVALHLSTSLNHSFPPPLTYQGYTKQGKIKDTWKNRKCSHITPDIAPLLPPSLPPSLPHL